MELIKAGADPLDAAIAGVAIVEADPTDRTVGLGGIPNEEGVVELDAAVMHGPTHGGGAVASLRNIVHPAAVARLVMKRTDHCLLVGEGALKFARAHGIPETNLLTDESRQIWLHWKETNGKESDWIAPPDNELPPHVQEFFGIRKTGTIHCSALDTHGNVGCIVYEMRRGMSPKDAALEACKRIAATTRDPRLLDGKKRPNFNVKFYCISKDGRYAGASLWAGAKMAVHDGDSAKLVDCASLYEEKLGND